VSSPSPGLRQAEPEALSASDRGRRGVAATVAAVRLGGLVAPKKTKLDLLTPR